jgi:hypothetical protein
VGADYYTDTFEDIKIVAEKEMNRWSWILTLQLDF